MGKVRRQHKLKVNIPAGIDDGQTISRPGYGSAGENGGSSGDLLVSVIVRPHARFERDGSSVLLEQEISYAQAALGAEIEIPTLDGNGEAEHPRGHPARSGVPPARQGDSLPARRAAGAISSSPSRWQCLRT